ncbi:hypothetical protein OQA88_2017 [Cercophora sp. LCS_1]
MADAAAPEQAEAMDTQASPAVEAAAPAATASEQQQQQEEPVATTIPEAPPDMPAAFPKKRRGRPPGRPNMTVHEADYKDNPLVQAWNDAKADRPMSVMPINIRQALTEASLVHDTQRNIFRLPSREFIYFVQGWITARHIASQRPSYINGLLIHSRGEDAPTSCLQCAERRSKNALGPFLTCRVLPGSYHNSCSNCKWFDNTSVCSLYTGPKPNRKRKAKESLSQDNTSAIFGPVDVVAESSGEQQQQQQQQQTPESGIDPALQSVGEVQFAEMGMQDALDAQIATQLLPELQRQESTPGSM